MKPPHRPRRPARAAAAALACVLALSAAPAADLKWHGAAVQITASEKRLPDFLRELAASQGTTAVIDPKIEGVISGRFVVRGRRGDDSARAVLDKVCANYGLTWYFDGSLLFIEPAGEARSETLPISGGNAQRIAEALNRLQIWDKRYPLTVSQGDNSVFVSGPRRYVDAVRQIVKSIDYRASLIDRAEVRLFPLRFAWANDIHLARAGRDVVVPGVVTTLRRLFDEHGGANIITRASAAAGATGGGATAQPRLTSGKAGRGATADAAAAPAADPADPDAPQEAWMANVPAAQFQADSRMNAVLVRDIAERMPQYARLIAVMDAKPRLVEIELTIMDISTDSLDSLGVDWRAHGAHADVQTGNGQNPPLTWGNATSAIGQTGLFAPPGVVLTASLGSEMRDFLLARVSALASKGQADFIARPKVLTLDNTEASLENKSEFYVKVPGFQDASLYTVTAGTDVRVTPLVIDEDAGRSVMLAINIGDDSLTTDTVEGVPIVRRRSVNTQAVVDDGRSVLLAGYSSEERSRADAGVPGLSSIPLIGNLFKYAQKKSARMERFYLLTPRFVTPSAAAASAPTVEGLRIERGGKGS